MPERQAPGSGRSRPGAAYSYNRTAGRGKRLLRRNATYTDGLSSRRAQVYKIGVIT